VSSRISEAIDKIAEIIKLLKDLSAILRDFYEASKTVGLLDPVRHLEAVTKRLEHIKRLLSRLFPSPLDKRFKLRR
jgi:hypothetical protein